MKQTNNNDSVNKQSFLVACPSCDLLADTSHLKHGETANCARCDHFLCQYKDDGIARSLSYSLSALVLLALACSFPFLSFKASGLESVMTLPQTALRLYDYGMTELSILVAAFILVIPLVILLLLLAICIPLYNNTPNPMLVKTGRMVFTLQHWAMAEVFLIGVIVSLVKIASMATVVLGISFWAYAGFTICFTLALSNLDRVQCWNAIEHLTAEPSS
ncbi:paraquat-inducible protein A [Oceanicoccus sagamiensis]|uniref:paraquat-inducible protein A n=1 Tax=Oceanicoccus sagamiensis TaxID=716816 RepID=UPI000A26952D|nr:paraquat-inducible protein A [Oceanicoccus sagamiensis]